MKDGVQIRFIVVISALGLAAGCWVVAIRQMVGMNMGIASQLGSFGFFIVLWGAMMAAMMLPAATPAILMRTKAGGRLTAVPLFVVSYLAVWTLVGVVIFVLYRPHGPIAAGTVVIAAGLYELTPLKARLRRRCEATFLSGAEFGMCCVGSSIGLMLVLVAVCIMSIAWMIVIAALVLAQRLLPVRAVVDVPVALTIIGLGVLIVVHPSFIPGLMPPM